MIHIHSSLKESLEAVEYDRVKVIDHYKLSGWTVIKKRHDQFVKEGFEGLVMRNPDKEYGVGKRSALYMIKVKDYKDDFLVSEPDKQSFSICFN